MKKINCRHCSKPCKLLGITECAKYEAKADRPARLPKLINDAIVSGNLQKVKELQDEQDSFNYGKC